MRLATAHAHLFPHESVCFLLASFCIFFLTFQKSMISKQGKHSSTKKSRLSLSLNKQQRFIAVAKETLASMADLQSKFQETLISPPDGQ